MEDIEVSNERIHEQINETAEELREKNEKRWTLYVAISTALMAVFAAVAGLMAGHHSNEALIEQIKASDNWAFYQAKGIKAEIRSIAANPDTAAIRRGKEEQADIKKMAEEAEHKSAFHLEKHVLLARSVTLLQIAIAISAISILTRRRLLWYVSMAIAIAGIVFLVTALL